MPTRRDFMKISAMAGAATLFPWRRVFPFEQSPTNLRKYVIGLPGLGPSGANEIGQYIPVAAPDTTSFPGSDYYQLVAGQYTELMHPDLPKATKLWGYAQSVHGKPDFKYLGPVIVASSGRPVRLTVKNTLPQTHILPVDASAFFTDAQAYPNKIAVHLHGNGSPWISDGGPFAWFTPDGGPVGPDYPFQPLDMKIKAGSFNYYHPNQQSARLLWYHDHGHDVTRLNAYAGLASAYILTDAAEAQLVSAGTIPATQIPLIIQDKSFKSVADQWGMPGDLWYPSVYEDTTTLGSPSMLYSQLGGGTGRWDLGDSSPFADSILTPLPVPSDVAEAFQDTILVNGAVYPYLNVQGKRYRFRILNGANARFFNLQLYVTNGSGEVSLVPELDKRGNPVLDPNGNPILVPNNPPGPAFIQIATEGGFLPNPVFFDTSGRGSVNANSNRPMGWDLTGSPDTNPTFGDATQFNLLLAPAERADVIIDFRGYEGKYLVLYGDAPAPFPGGDIRNDYFTGAPDLRGIGGANTPQPGYGPNTRTLMLIKVGSTASDSMSFKDTVSALKKDLPKVFADTQPTPIDPSGVPVRQLTLNETFDQFGRLIQMLGTTDSIYNGTFGRFLDDEPTETPHVGDTEVWQIFNLTGDTHPIHFHLVNVQVISRAPWPGVFNNDFNAIGTERPPDRNEAGWKSTVRMNPGEVVKVAMKFDLANVPTTVFNPATQLSTRTGITGHEYVWHCHILEHEEHDMMRPLIVIP